MQRKKAGRATAPRNKRPSTTAKLLGRIEVLESQLVRSECAVESQRAETLQTLAELARAVEQIASQERELVNLDGRLRAEAKRTGVEYLRSEVSSAAAEILIIDALFQGTIDPNGIGKLCEHISEENGIPLAEVAGVMKAIAKTAIEAHQAEMFKKIETTESDERSMNRSGRRQVTLTIMSGRR